ncbi:MAG: pseudouridine synthase [Hyphomicrobium sp.]|nr:pseudouridine synthase [Hyphomicrobium sp.]PPC81549.1 MAG: pseudouridine synthase [Hyphomicrobium sp.]
MDKRDDRQRPPARPTQRNTPRPARQAKPGEKPGAKPSAERPAAPKPPEPMRIAKAMARAGLCSRREAERWIADGRVRVNGTLLTTPALDVGPKHKILVDGQPLPLAEPVRLWRYHKPRGLVTTHNDPEGRATVFHSLPDDMPRVISIGRLDFNTEGLLLLTNDGELARHLELPETGWLRRYRVRARGRVSQADLDKLKDGIEIEGVEYGPIEATIDTFQGANAWLTLGLREGKNREVRKILGSLGLEVGRLIRISFGPFQLLDLKEGTVELVKRRVLADQMGPTLAAEFGLLGEIEPERPKRFQAPRPLRRDDGGDETAGSKLGQPKPGRPKTGREVAATRASRREERGPPVPGSKRSGKPQFGGGGGRDGGRDGGGRGPQGSRSNRPRRGED